MQEQETKIRPGDIVQTVVGSFVSDLKLVVCADYVSARFSWVEPGANLAIACERIGISSLVGVRRMHECSDDDHARWLDFWEKVAKGLIDVVANTSASASFAFAVVDRAVDLHWSRPQSLRGVKPEERSQSSERANVTRWWESANERHQAELYAQITNLQERGGQLLEENRALRAEIAAMRHGIEAIMGTVHGKRSGT